MTVDLFASAGVTVVFGRDRHVQRLLDFEVALAAAEAEAGIIPDASAQAIAAACRAARIDLDVLWREGAEASTIVPPLLDRIGRGLSDSARPHLHFGATSQDAIDTALALQLREALAIVEGLLLRAAALCAGLAERHRSTPMPGRTLLQRAVPITFGLKAARWLGLLTRGLLRLRRVRDETLVLQLGGAAGTLHVLGSRGPRVAELLGARLELSVPELPWHAERDRMADLASTLGIVAGSAAKIALDLSLLAQNEVGEVTPPLSSAGRSSAMPHKRNASAAMAATASARLAMGFVPMMLGGMAQEHERAAGAWQAEWTAVPQLCIHTGSALEWLAKALDGVQVHPDRMRTNLGGESDIGSSEVLVDRALAAHRAVTR